MYGKYVKILKNRHHKFSKLIKLLGPMNYKLPKWHSLDDAVLYSVIGQMLSVKAANSIINGLHEGFNKRGDIFEWASINYKRKGPIYGVSKQKRKALKEWFVFQKNNKALIKKWNTSDSDLIRKEITHIWGFGKWAADMILIFHLGKMDVWPESDGGIQKGVKVLFNNTHPATVRKIVEGAETTAALYVWQMLNLGKESLFQ